MPSKKKNQTSKHNPNLIAQRISPFYNGNGQDISHSKRSDIQSKFSNKMINSGHSRLETKKTLVKGTTKYLLLIECSMIDQNDPEQAMAEQGHTRSLSQSEISTIPVVGRPVGRFHADYNATAWPQLII